MKKTLLANFNLAAQKNAASLFDRTNLYIISSTLILFSLSVGCGAQAEPASTLVAEQASQEKDGKSAETLAKSDGSNGKTVPKKIEALPNFHEVHPYLYRGGEPSDAGLSKLHAMGVKTIVDLRAFNATAKHEKAEVEKLGMKYINLPMDYHAPTDTQVKTLMEVIEGAKKTEAPVLVHCAHGSDRTGCMIGIWRVKNDGWSFDDTYKEMRKYYFGPKFVQLRDAVKQRAAK